MNIRRLNDEGLRQFADFLANIHQLPPGFVPREILTDPDCTDLIYPSTSLEPRTFRSKLELAEYLDNQISDVAAARFANDRGIWAWISLLFFEYICPKRRGGRWHPSDEVRWIPAMDNWQRYYRHLLLVPWRIYRTFKDNPRLAMSLLYNDPGILGETVEQIASRQELVTNRAAVAAATSLYYDMVTDRPKPGHGGKGDGSPRRFAAVLNQFDLTYDLYAMTEEQLLDLLPEEFDRFRSR